MFSSSVKHISLSNIVYHSSTIFSSGEKDISLRSVKPALRRIASRGQRLDERRQLLSTPSGIKAIRKLFSVLQTYF